MRYSLLILFVLLIIFDSCQKKLDIDIPESEKHIVLNGIINPDSTIRVRVTKSKGVLENNPIKILKDADVKLYENDVFLEKLQYSDSGYFYSSVKPGINTIYKITAEYTGLNSVEATTQIYNIPEIESVDTIMKYTINEYGEGYIDTTYEIHYELTFKDAENTSDYYFISLTQLYPVLIFDGTSYVLTGYEMYSDYFDSTDPVLSKENNEFIINGMNGRVFNDELFNGNSYTLSFSSFYQKMITYNKGVSDNSYPVYFIINFLKVSEAMYNYIFSYNLNQYSTDDPFAQPVQIYSNVKNGLGLFSGYSMTTDTIALNNLKK